MSKPRTASIRNWLEYLAFRCVAGLLAALPLETASWLSGSLWRRLAPFSSRHRRALDHLAKALPEMTDAQRKAIVLQMWDNLGRVFAEAFHLREIAESGRITVDDNETWRQRFDEDKRAVICAPHLGNWELGASCGTLLGTPPAGIYQRVKNPLVNAYVQDLRLPFYPGGLFAKDDRAAQKSLRHVRRGGALATMADLRDWRGIPVEFFGRPADTSPFPALLARSTGAPLIAAALVRTPRGKEAVHFILHLREIAVPQTDDRDADVRAATENLQAAFEDFIRAYPGQWMWAHRRWDALPWRNEEAVKADAPTAPAG